MKKITAILLAVLMLLAITACGKKPDSSGSNSGNSNSGSNNSENGDPSGNNGSGNTESSVFVLDGSKLGVLQPAKDTGKLKINGLIFTTGSGHHDYPGIDELAQSGYKTSGLYSEYYLSEWIAVYGDIENNSPTMIFVLPNDPNADYSKMTAAQLDAASEGLSYSIYAGEAIPDTDDNGYMVDFYVHEDLGKGLYNVFFTDGVNVCYIVQLNILPFPEE
jgi:hypothetical protein